MSAASYATYGQVSTGNGRVVPSGLDQRVAYVHSEGTPAYEDVHPAASFSLRYERGHGYWIVRDEVTGIFGCAKRPSGARRDFQLAVGQHLDVLERQDVLSPELSWQL